MARLPVLSGAEEVHTFEKAGWMQDRQRGSHFVMLKSGCNVSLSVPQHRELAPGTLRAPHPRSGHNRRRFRRPAVSGSRKAYPSDINATMPPKSSSESVAGP